MTSLSKDGRLAGFLYILASVVGLPRLMYIPNKLFVTGDATATANNIAAHEVLFRFGIVNYLLGGALFSSSRWLSIGYSGESTRAALC